MLHTPVGQLVGIGETGVAVLEKQGIVSLWDLLLHLPIRYEDRTQLTNDADCLIGHYIQREGVVSRSQILPARKPIHALTLQSGDLDFQLIFLNYDQWAHTLPAVGNRVRIYGQLKRNLQGAFELLHPSMQRLTAGKPLPLPSKLTPIYSAIGNIKQASLRKAINDGLTRLDNNPTADVFNQFAFAQNHFSLIQALFAIHHAEVGSADSLLAGTHPAIQRLALEELTAHQLLALETRTKQADQQAPALIASSEQMTHFLAQLPFQLTAGQKNVWQEIQQDLQSSQPMHRLLQGDVGSGKTVLAGLSAVQAMDSGYQVAIMAPTEILAEQLYTTLSPWMTVLGFSIRLLTGSSKAGDKRQTLLELMTGKLNLVVGTHALFQEEVRYAKLGLVIVDEQHRFGVEQRLALKQKGQADQLMPHLLHMTATPIPRSLAMAFYGDLDISSLTERPPGRQAIDTLLIPEAKREYLAERVMLACRKGAQAYWVCPFIEASEAIDAQNVKDTEYWLRTRYPDVRIGLVHGQLTSKDKDRQMQAFKAGKLDLLIATTVIEVGVNVPNATLMVIDNAERFGLAQLHQLRGRVGRGEGKSYCSLIFRPPLSETGQARLSAIRDSQDGFALAEQDLLLRGPGEVLGTRQTGLSEWRVADLLRDTPLHEPARQLAMQIRQHSPQQAQVLTSRWLAHRLRFVGG